jgi:type I restriction enzyme M protein
MDIEGDAFGKIYEYFLGHFAMSEGQKGGEFFTPTAIVQLIVGIIEPFHGRIFDPACGSGDMFVQSARFVTEHQKNPEAELSIYGQEKVTETVRLGKMNLSVHGLAGDIRQGNAYYEDLHRSTGKFDFVMANSASDARGSEMDVRRQIIEARAVDVMVSVGSNFFYTVTLPCTLWFLDKGKSGSASRADQVLFIDARHIYRQIDRAHRDWTPAQIEFLANITRIYRCESAENLHDSADLLTEHFPDGRYVDIPGLCKVSTLAEIEAQGWSLNPGRYVGVAAREEDDFDFKVRLVEQNEELEILNAEARELEARIAENVAKLLEGER